MERHSIGQDEVPIKMRRSYGDIYAIAKIRFKACITHATTEPFAEDIRNAYNYKAYPVLLDEVSDEEIEEIVEVTDIQVEPVEDPSD